MTTLSLKSRTRRKESLPETVSQAKLWDRVKHQVLAVGLCEPCAAQYAWGVQIGFTDSLPPCDDCRNVVAQHGGRDRPHEWRTLHRVRGEGWQQ